MGRRPKPTGRVRIPLKLYKIIEERANRAGHDITVEVELLLTFALENEGQLTPIKLLGRIDALLAEKTRRK